MLEGMPKAYYLVAEEALDPYREVGIASLISLRCRHGERTRAVEILLVEDNPDEIPAKYAIAVAQ